MSGEIFLDQVPSGMLEGLGDSAGLPMQHYYHSVPSSLSPSTLSPSTLSTALMRIRYNYIDITWALLQDCRQNFKGKMRMKPNYLATLEPQHQDSIS